jgi:branched-chain amino acid transport system substrate-binding protein
MTLTGRVRVGMTLALAILILTTAGMAYGASGRLAGQEIRIGAIVPSSGPFAEWGKTDTIALQMLEKEVNAAGGVEGATLKIIIYDDGSKPAQAANLVRKLASDDKVLAIAGPLTSSTCEVAFPVANELKVVTISQASSKPGVAKANRPWAFRNTIDEAILANTAVPYMKKEFKVSSAAIIYDAKDAVSTSMGSKLFPAILEKNGIKLLNAGNPLTFNTGDIDVAAQVTSLKSLNPDAIVIAADYSQAITVLREMKRQGFIRPVIGGSPLISTAILKAAPEIPIIAPATFYPGIKAGTSAKFAGNLLPLLRKGAGLPPEIEVSMYDANIYEIVQMYLTAVSKAGVTAKPADLASDREKIMKYLTNLTGFQGLAGPISFNADGDAIKTFFVLLGKGGKWTQKERGCSGPAGSCGQ